MTNMGQYADDPEVNEYWTSDGGKKQKQINGADSPVAVLLSGRPEVQALSWVPKTL